MKLLAYHGKQEIKDKYVARMKKHIEADELVRGIGFMDGKGCAVGCTLNNYDHIEYETALGFPIWIGEVEDHLFERMSLEKSKTFPLVFLEAIQPGMVLESIKKSFLIYILEQALTTFDNEKFTDIRDSILRVITLHKTDATEAAEWAQAGAAAERATDAWSAREAATEAVRAAATAAAAAARAAVAWAMGREAAGRGAARAAAVGSAEAAGWAAAGWAAWSAKEMGACAAASAAKGAVSTAVWATAEAIGAAWEAGRPAKAACEAAYDKYADKLIELIKQCTIESE